MELTKEYKDYCIEFVINKEIDKYFKSKSIDKVKLFGDKNFWFKSILFRVIDDDGDGQPDEVYGKKFKVIFYGIIVPSKEDNEQFEHETTHTRDERRLIEDEILLNVESKFFAKIAIVKSI